MDEREIEILTRIYLKAYMTALDETKNPELAMGTAFAVATIAADKCKKQTDMKLSPLAVAMHMMMNQKSNGKSEESKKDEEIPR